VWKHPVTGPRMVRRLNIDGDGQGDLAGHGGEQRAVFVYQIEAYRYWQDQLGRQDFGYGQFGENFTVQGLADNEVCICGPSAFMADVSAALAAFARSDVSARWDPRYGSLLQLAEACDVPVRWSCRTGVCQTCETALTSGTVSYTPDPVDDPADGSAFICCSQPRDDLVLDL
jgi:ferredoxin